MGKAKTTEHPVLEVGQVWVDPIDGEAFQIIDLEGYGLRAICVNSVNGLRSLGDVVQWESEVEFKRYFRSPSEVTKVQLLMKKYGIK